MQDFLDSNCDIFYGSRKGDEQLREYHDLYKEFERRVNDALEGFIAAEFAELDEWERRDMLASLGRQVGQSSTRRRRRPADPGRAG